MIIPSATDQLYSHKYKNISCKWSNVGASSSTTSVTCSSVGCFLFEYWGFVNVSNIFDL